MTCCGRGQNGGRYFSLMARGIFASGWSVAVYVEQRGEERVERLWGFGGRGEQQLPEPILLF